MTANRDGKREIKLTPPPRVKKVKPVVPSRGPAAETHTNSRSFGWVTIATFVLLLTVAFGVFFYLPQWVRTRGTRPVSEKPAETEVQEDAPLRTPAERIGTLREQADLKLDAEELRERVERQRQILEGKNVSRWGGEAFQGATALISEGDRQQSDRDFPAAAASYEQALGEFESLANRAPQILREALAEGGRALAAGNSAAATEAFRLASSIDPGNPVAATGLKRAKVLNDVVRLMATGAEDERRGNLERAVESYRRAASLDPLSREAQQALARLDSRFADEAFTKAMSEGVVALDRKDYPVGREAFERAQAIKPGAPEVADGLAQVEEGLRLEKIARHREKALVLEEEETWRAAAAEYQSVLDVDPMIQFAQLGKARSLERAELVDRLAFHLKNPNRLSDEKVLQEVSGLLHVATSVEPAGPKLKAQVLALEDLIAKAAAPQPVRLVSDEMTDVVIYKVGRLGTFESRELDLRPGTYTVVGTRQGYRDVRLKLVVAAGKEPEILVVRCEEKI